MEHRKFFSQPKGNKASPQQSTLAFKGPPIKSTEKKKDRSDKNTLKNQGKEDIKVEDDENEDVTRYDNNPMVEDRTGRQETVTDNEGGENEDTRVIRDHTTGGEYALQHSSLFLHLVIGDQNNLLNASTLR